MGSIMYVLLFLSLGIMAIGIFTWTSSGKRFALMGAVNASLFTMILANRRANEIRYVFLALFVALIVGSAKSIDKRTWRSMAPALILGGVTILAIVASYALTDVSREMRVALLAVIIISATLFAVVVLVQTGRLLEFGRRSQIK